MKAIILHTAVLDNSGARREAGAELEVGEGKPQIRADRATQLVRRHLAVEAGDKAVAATAPEKKPGKG